MTLPLCFHCGHPVDEPYEPEPQMAEHFVCALEQTLAIRYDVVGIWHGR